MRRVFGFILALSLLPLVSRADLAGNSSPVPRFSSALSMSSSTNSTPEGLRGVGVDEHLGRQLPLETLFSDENGNVQPLGKFIDPTKPVVLQLGYLSCTMLCDEVSRGMVNSIKNVDLSVGADYQVLFISIDPKEQRVEALKKKQSFVKLYDRTGASNSWHYLVGDQHSIDAVTKAIGFNYKWLDESQMFSHPAVLTVLTPTGTISHYVYGVTFPEKEVRDAIVTASAGKTQATTNYVLLVCSHILSYVGANTASAMLVMRTGGALTMILLFGFIIYRIRRERKAAPPMPEIKAHPLAASHSPL